MPRKTKRTAPAILLVIGIVTMVVSIIGFIASLLLNAFVFDEFDAYGEVPIPGQTTLQLPAGEVTVSFHTVLIGSGGGSGLPIPRLGMTIDPPPGVAEPVVTENFGGTTTVNNDARVRVWVAQIPEAGTYQVSADGDVGAFLQPRLAFGHGATSTGWVPWLFAGLFGFAVLDFVISVVWMTRSRKAPPAMVGFPDGPVDFDFPPEPDDPGTPAPSYQPTDQGIRIEQLKNLAALRDSGALTEDEFQAEKRRVLEGG